MCGIPRSRQYSTFVMDRMVVAARQLKRREQRFGHRAGREYELLSDLEVVEIPLLAHLVLHL